MQPGQKIYTKEGDVNFRKPSDTANGVEKMPLGQELIVVDAQPWIRVTKNGQIGWIRSDFITEAPPPAPRPAQQSLQLIIGTPNLFDSPNTIAIRQIIGDEFGGGAEKDHLNCTEYVQYRIQSKLGVKIKWPPDRPRNGGKWASIFQKNNLFKVLSDPLPNCAMCFTDGISMNPATNAIGHVAFVEDVLPDGSVRVSEANWPPAGQLPKGQYHERNIPKQKWQTQYKAQFVEFT